MEPLLARRICVAESTLFEVLDDEIVLMNMMSGAVLNLSGVPARIWQLLSTHHQVSDIMAALVAEYEVEKERLEGDVKYLISVLSENQFVSLEDDG